MERTLNCTIVGGI